MFLLKKRTRKMSSTFLQVTTSFHFTTSPFPAGGYQTAGWVTATPAAPAIAIKAETPKPTPTSAPISTKAKITAAVLVVFVNFLNQNKKASELWCKTANCRDWVLMTGAPHCLNNAINDLEKIIKIISA